MAPAMIPAWRRLGLKLKSEETGHSAADAVLPTIESNKPPKRRKLELSNGERSHINNESPPTNGSLLSPSKANTTPGGRRSSLRSSSLEDNHPQSPPRKRKSVSFTPDTKVEDGGKLVTGLHSPLAPPTSLFNQYAADQDSVEDTRQSVEVDIDADVPEATKKAKKSKKSKSTLISANPPATNGDNNVASSYVSPRLQYLVNYSQANSTWKFNKNKEVWILKHALDLEQIPSSYDAQLAAYVRGLGQKMSRDALRASAQAAVDADEAALAKELSAAEAASPTKTADAGPRRRSRSPHDPEAGIYPDSARIRDYAAALSQVRHQVRQREFAREEAARWKSAGFQERLFRRRRAELLLWEVEPSTVDFSQPEHRPTDSIRIEKRTTVITTEPGKATKPTADGQPGKPGRRRRRRRRTKNSDDDSSSSESSTDSEREQDQRIATALVKGLPLPDMNKEKAAK